MRGRYSREGMEEDYEDAGERIEEGSAEVGSTKVDVQS